MEPAIKLFSKTIGQAQKIYGSINNKSVDLWGKKDRKYKDFNEQVEEKNKQKIEEIEPFETEHKQEIKLLKKVEKDLLNDFYDVLDLKIREFTKEEKELFLKTLLEPSDEEFMNDVEKLILKIEKEEGVKMTKEETNIFAEIMMAYRDSLERKEPFVEFKDSLNDLILDIKKTANLTWKKIEKIFIEYPDIMNISLSVFAIGIPTILLIIAIIIAKDNGENELDKKIEKMI